MKPRDARNVMASRQRTAPDALDFYPTPPWAARAGGELIRALDPQRGLIASEPACGAGHMAHGLADTFETIWASDIFDHKPLEGVLGGPVVLKDFLAADWAEGYGPFDWIVTNPPFKAAEAFARLAWRRSTRGVAMLCRSAFEESVDRYTLLYEGASRLAVQAPFSERVPMQKGLWDPDGSTATAYSWFIWLKPAALAACPVRPAIEAAWAAGGVLKLPIAPGAKRRLHRAEDVQLFCRPGDAPLLEGLG